MNALEQWLTRATRGLSGESRAKVRAEIEAHYRAALDEPGATEAAALASLGDAAHANHQYRQVLLTSAEARYLREARYESKLFCSTKATWFLRVAFVLALLLSVASFANGHAYTGRLLAVGGAGMALFYVVRRLPLHPLTQGRVSRTVRWVWLTAGYAVAAYDNKTMWSMLPALVWVPLYLDWQAASIRRKLPVDQWPKSLYL